MLSRRHLFLWLMFAVLSSADVSRAEKTDLVREGGGDLANPDDWSNGLPVDPNYTEIETSEPLSFTLSQSLTARLQIGVSGTDVDASFDLQGNSAPIVVGFFRLPLETLDQIRLRFSHGELTGIGGGLQQLNPINSFQLESVDVRWNGLWEMRSDESDILLDEGSHLDTLRVEGGRHEVVIKGGSSVGAIDVKGSEYTRLVIEDGAFIGPGRVEVNSPDDRDDVVGPADIVIRGGVTSSEEARMRIPSESTMLVEGSDTRLDLADLMTTRASLEAVLRPKSTVSIRGGAQVHLHGPPYRGDGEVLIPNIYSLSAVTLDISDEGSELAVLNDPGKVIYLSVTNGGLYRSQGTTDVVQLLVKDAEVHASTRSLIVPPNLSHALGLPEAIVRIEHGNVVGDVVGFGRLQLNEGLVEGDVRVVTVSGRGTIDGDLETYYPPSSGPYPLPVIEADGLITVTGNLEIGSAKYIFSSPDQYGQIHAMGEIGGKTDFAIYVPNSPNPYWPIGNLISFEPTFAASVGDRFVFFTYSGGTITVDPLHFLDRNPPDIAHIIKRNWFNVHFENTPEGYEFEFFVENNELGFVITSVPEASSLLLVGLAVVLCGAVRWRAGTAGRKALPLAG